MMGRGVQRSRQEASASMVRRASTLVVVLAVLAVALVALVLAATISWFTMSQPLSAGDPEPQPDDAVLFDLLLAWAPDEKVRHRILVENPAALYDFPKSA